jgi:hypothetical protein
MLEQRGHMYLNTLRVYVYSYYFKMDTWTYSRVKNGLLPRIRTFREITFFMLCVTRIFKSYFECLRLVALN